MRQAIALDPENARARRELAYLAVIGWVFRFDKTPVPPQEITAQASKAVQLDPADARAHMVAAAAYFFNKQLDLFEREAQQAMALAPYDAEILATLGYMIASSGQWQRGVALAEKANALNADAAVGWYHATLYYRLLPDRATTNARSSFVGCTRTNKRCTPISNTSQSMASSAARRKRAKTGASCSRRTPAGRPKASRTGTSLWNMRDEDIAKLMDGIYKSGVLGVEAKPGQ